MCNGITEIIQTVIIIKPNMEKKKFSLKVKIICGVIVFLILMASFLVYLGINGQDLGPLHTSLIFIKSLPNNGVVEYLDINEIKALDCEQVKSKDYQDNILVVIKYILNEDLELTNGQDSAACKFYVNGKSKGDIVLSPASGASFPPNWKVLGVKVPVDYSKENRIKVCCENKCVSSILPKKC